MISKRITAVLAGATTLSLVLAACGDNGGELGRRRRPATP